MTEPKDDPGYSHAWEPEREKKLAEALKKAFADPVQMAKLEEDFKAYKAKKAAEAATQQEPILEPSSPASPTLEPDSKPGSPTT